ncbi:zinc metalloprotease HtpX [Alloscardovia macacae]|uniref:Protease HtpX homolog n=1 Tax=Alloscardovia macacae TaxID=1160091 RepID=A0A1Y2SWW9_9BIFI|nr:zinc metalloprotease HtpX [Alloscardovia macacae]OTA25572.1 zinc metalloprotease HtpX [Alloscardovia macacae]OTA28149.1 zinc metalloprotease HtpX [Alloscardovia macacae]
MKIHGHANGAKTAVLFGLMWALIFAVWYFTSRSTATLGFYAAISLAMTFGSYWFSDSLSLASMQAREVSEAEYPQLYRMVRELSGKAGKPMPRIYVAPTLSPNAFATGRNERHAAVCCTAGILDLLDEREIRGVLGHELMHVYNRDILTSSIAAALATIISYLAYSLQFFGGSRRDERESGPLGAIGAVLAIILAPISASLIQMAISRTREYDADEDGSTLSGDPLALASALQKIERGVQAAPLRQTAGTQNVASMMISSPFRAADVSRLFSTHPPTEQRIARLHQMAREMGQSPDIPVYHQ